MYLIGYDIGSSSIKAALVEVETGATLAVAQSPATEMGMIAHQPGWAEQDPDEWWQHVCTATRQLLADCLIAPAEIKGIGISYQMHGLVVVDEKMKPLRPSIIWCDSRAVQYGNLAFDEIGHEKCRSHLLNSPANFTAAKLAWVKENEPGIFAKIRYFMLPGDYIALRLTGEPMTTPSGLSEGILWDFQKNDVADIVLDYFGFDKKLVPHVTPTFSLQGKLTPEAAAATGLAEGTPVTYRAGDQPNNALSLNVLQPGEVAATGGTSGVVYGVVDRPTYDLQSRVNGFCHVTHGPSNHQSPITNHRIGILLCINGAGSLYRWLRQTVGQGSISYPDMERLAASVPIGSDGLRILPFGNGAERMLGNLDPGAQVNGLQLNRHTAAHLYRAGLEGIAFSFVYGVQILKEMGLGITVMRVGNDNLFQSAVFSKTIATLLGCSIDVVETTGAVGAAKAAGVATGIYPSIEAAMASVRVTGRYEPEMERVGEYRAAYGAWEGDLAKAIA
ncbi:MAG: carbohydrate kinase [Saprospiraceae bacterium]|nr:carbohydrate kinase [Saprospiraceae bacterium]MCF8250516.1 carbohydrate kinase [Saprospiraceae bacterium]MCF8279656.1 carbohydrate kinase [Bacteroidales bacterium]MCF8312442.1 carbohydrate kinase [Saprospiraceae bacterium]MCF8440741.1 carbohydrate kinase [Saprospiraceae bacterium]